MKKKTLLHIRNQEVLVDSDEAKRVLKLIQEKEPIEEFASEHSEYGHFINYIYAVTGGLVIVSVWRATPGYSWEEKIVTFIKIPQN